MSIDYRSVSEARDLGGLRLVLSTGVPGPWGEAAKSILHAKALAYCAVAQHPGMANEELVAWTGHANAPIAMYDNEAPRTGWAEILFLAERLAPEPRLIPDDPVERAQMFGLSHEICGENGLGWSRRLMMIDALLSPDGSEVGRRAGAVLGARYGYSKEAAAAAPGRAAAVLDLLAGQLEKQHAAGHDFLVGNALSAVDIYWATFAVLLCPMDAEHCPMPEYLRGWYNTLGPVVGAALTPALVAHRDRIYRNYLQLPMSF
ncbi:MAG: hypothetical protein ABR587_09970 [Candidatus Binatia bacterium]